MKKKNNNNKLLNLILPNKRTNLFIITILILGITAGSVFLMLLSDTDKQSVIAQIQQFMTNISTNNIDNGLALKNSLIINYLFIGLIWCLGLSIIGIIINIFLTFIKGFLVGFSVASLILTYSTKGIIPSILYVIFGQTISIITIAVVSIYSIMFTTNLLKIITSKKANNSLMLKKYLVILFLAIISTFIASTLEAYVFPNILKLIVKYYL